MKHTGKKAGLSASETALRLAEQKARAIADVDQHCDALVIGADQILECQERWFDKPQDRAGARAHLCALAGQTHVLNTAVVVRRSATTLWRHLETPRLRMRPLTESFIEDYLDAEGDAILGSVGAYRIEGRGIQLFDAVDGQHSAILGLPLLPLLGFLRTVGALDA